MEERWDRRIIISVRCSDGIHAVFHKHGYSYEVNQGGIEKGNVGTERCGNERTLVLQKKTRKFQYAYKMNLCDGMTKTMERAFVTSLVLSLALICHLLSQYMYSKYTCKRYGGEMCSLHCHNLHTQKKTEKASLYKHWNNLHAISTCQAKKEMVA